jgi:hypothetical protein
LIDGSRTFPTQRNGEAKQENPDSSPDLDPVDGKLIRERAIQIDWIGLDLFIETKSATVQTYKA